MRVLVAGATSTPGRATVRELVARGHEVHGLTRSPRRGADLEALGATPLVADALDAGAVADAVARAAPEVVISLLVELPPRGPTRVSDFRATRRLWRDGVPRLLEAALAAGARRFVAESVIFAYGYGRFSQPVDEETPAEGGEILRGHRKVLGDLRAMERRVLDVQGLEPVVLRYGAFHGRGVPSTDEMVRGLRRRLLPLAGGGHGLFSWLEIGDAARATVAAATLPDARGVYNVVDDEPVEFGTYLRALARAIGAPAPISVPLWLARVALPHGAVMTGQARVPVSNARIKRELDWAPRFPDYRAVFADLVAAPNGPSPDARAVSPL